MKVYLTVRCGGSNVHVWALFVVCVGACWCLLVPVGVVVVSVCVVGVFKIFGPLPQTPLRRTGPPKISLFFFSLPPENSFFLLSLGGLLDEFWWCF